MSGMAPLASVALHAAGAAASGQTVEPSSPVVTPVVVLVVAPVVVPVVVAVVAEVVVPVVVPVVAAVVRPVVSPVVAPVSAPGPPSELLPVELDEQALPSATAPIKTMANPAT
jgi:hypothetical protein